MALVLAIEPDLRQAAILKRIVKEQVKANLVVVDSRDAAMEAIGRAVPDVLLLSALMSPRDEDELIQHLRALDGADHLQTHTIPQLASTLADSGTSKGGGLLRAFRRKKEPEIAAGCNPDLFADEIRTFIKYAAEKKEERRALIESGQLAADAAARSGITRQVELPAPQPKTSSWDDPFAWNPSGTRPAPADEPAPGTEQDTAAEHDPWSTDYRRTFAVKAVAEPAETTPYAQLPAPDAQLPAPEEPRIEPPAIVAAASEPAVTPEPISIADPEPERAPAAAIAHEPLVVEHTFTPTIPDYQLPTPDYHVSTASYQVPAPDYHEEPAVETTLQGAASKLDREAHVEEPVAFEAERVVIEHEIAAAAAEPESIAAAEPEPIAAATEPEPIAAAPEPVAAQPRLPASLGPLATWVRFEAATPKAGERTTTDELRELMSHLSIPPQVAGVTYARGCRIRRVRVRGGRDRRKGTVPGPVILSRRLLDKERQTPA